MGIMKKIILTILVCLMGRLVAYSQNQSGDFKKLMNSAESEFYLGDYYKALQIYEQAHQKDSSDKLLNFRMGVCRYNLKQYTKARIHFERSSSSVSYEIFRYKASLAHMDRKFKKAINYYNAYKLVTADKDLDDEEVDRLIKKIAYAEQAVKSPLDVEIQNVGTSINTQYDEYVPLISANEKMMMFTSRRPGSTGGLMDYGDRNFEDIYISYQENDSPWSNPKQLREGINTATNDACVGLSADGENLYIFRTDEEDIFSGNLYECNMNGENWGDPVKLSPNVNSEYVESSATIATDNSILYFSSDREGGYGGKDLYKSKRLPNGEWGLPTNLGPTVNTAQDEDAPFIHSNGKTLYFSSTGHQNMGGYDIFKTDIEDGTWSIPINIGYPINTVKDDIFFVLAADEKVGYYSSSKEGGYGGQDIYRVVLKEEPIQYYILKGNVINMQEKPIAARITLIENETKKIQGIYKAKALTGNFIMLLDPAKTYNVVIEAEDYYSLTSQLIFDINNEGSVSFKLDKKR